MQCPPPPSPAIRAAAFRLQCSHFDTPYKLLSNNVATVFCVISRLTDWLMDTFNAPENSILYMLATRLGNKPWSLLRMGATWRANQYPTTYIYFTEVHKIARKCSVPPPPPAIWAAAFRFSVLILTHHTHCYQIMLPNIYPSVSKVHAGSFVVVVVFFFFFFLLLLLLLLLQRSTVVFSTLSVLLPS